MLVSAETARRLRDRVRLRRLGALALKNISTPVDVWQVENKAGESVHRAAVVEPATAERAR